MISGVYHPLYDPYYGLYRVLSILSHINKEIEPETLGILDFYLMFPMFLIDFDVKRIKPVRTAINKIPWDQYDYEYGRLPNPTVLYKKLDLIRNMSIQTLITKGIAEMTAGEATKLSIEFGNIPEGLNALIAEDIAKKSHLYDALRELAVIPLRGKDGLKRRSHLLEYRYDQIG